MPEEETRTQPHEEVVEQVMREVTATEREMQNPPPVPDPTERWWHETAGITLTPGRQALNQLQQVDPAELIRQARAAQQTQVQVPVEPHPDTVGVKLTAEVLLGRSLLDLLTSAPNNPMVRTMISKHCRKTIPAELDSVDKIIEWIEANVTLPPPVVTDISRPAMATRAVAQPAEDNVLSLEAYKEGTESGTCHYSCGFTEERRVRITMEQFENIVSNSDSYEELIANLQEYAEEELSECGGNQDNGEYDYSDHECRDSDIEESGVRNMDQARSVITQLLVQMGNRIEDRDDLEEFNERFGL